MLQPTESRWVVALNGRQIVAVQHGCGAASAPVNCSIDENQNWFCPSCSEIYGAAYPLEEWSNTTPIEQEDADEPV